MKVKVIDNIKLTVWFAGIQIEKTDTPSIVFISKAVIGSLHVNKDLKGSFIRYIHKNPANGFPVDLVSWISVPNDYAFEAYEFIITHLYERPTETPVASQLYI